MRTFSGVSSKDVGKVRILSLDNPARKNALSCELYQALTGKLDAAARDESIRVLVLAGSERIFSSGHDLDDFINKPIKDAEHPVYLFMQKLLQFEKPLVAAVEGHAIGIGCTLLLHCDLVYAGKSAIFQLPFVQLGLCPEFGSSFMLPALVGRQRAAELLLLGEHFDAATAESLGLINQQVMDGEALGQALEVAQRLAVTPRQAVLATKQLLALGERASIEAIMAKELEILVSALQSEEFSQAVHAYKTQRVARRKEAE